MKKHRNKSQSNKDIYSENYFIKQKQESMALYTSAWCNTEFANIEYSVCDLIYQIDFDESMLYDFLEFPHDLTFGGSDWSAKGILNFPGPFYTAATDTCGTGIIESPNNIIFDEHCMEYVMIQPRNAIELLQLWDAGTIEVFGSYYCDGNKYWTIQLVKDWWKNRIEIFEYLKVEELIKLNCNQEKRYEHYLENHAALDLSKYCFFFRRRILSYFRKITCN